MKFVDAHIHLSEAQYSEFVDELIVEAKNSNVVALVSNSTDLETSVNNLGLAAKYPSKVYPALGIHPSNVNALKENELEETSQLILNKGKRNMIVAIGEIGLDYKYEAAFDKQLLVFDKMLHLAEKINLPVIIHSRGTTSQIIEMFPSYNINRILLHWFSNPVSALSKVIEHGYYITEGPPLVYSNSIQKIVKEVPITNLLSETDGPVTYYKPPFNGKLTTPSLIPKVVEGIAKVKNMSLVDVADQIAENFETFFNVQLT